MCTHIYTQTLLKEENKEFPCSCNDAHTKTIVIALFWNILIKLGQSLSYKYLNNFEKVSKIIKKCKFCKFTML